MTFIDPLLPNFLEKLNKLDASATPSWGSMSAQRMVEHLSDAVGLALGEHAFPLEIPADKVHKAQGFLMSEHPMPKNFEAGFAPKEVALRNQDIEAAINEFELTWNKYVAFFLEHPGIVTLHPNFGELNFDMWQQLHSKHISHHLEQFGLL